jgi:hypothetical protein
MRCGLILVLLMSVLVAVVPPGGATLPLATMVEAVETCLDVMAEHLAANDRQAVAALSS